MNVIVLCSDTFRYDHLAYLGLQSVQTPNLDRLAPECARFDDFWLCSFPTVVNRIEVFTGRYTFPLIDWGPLPYHFPVLAEVFKHHRVHTALIADNPHLMEAGRGFGRGFDWVEDIPGQMHDDFLPESEPMIDVSCPVEKLDVSAKRLARYRRNAYWYRQRGTNPTESVFRKSIEWLEKPPEPFFLWIDSFDPHEPWDAPQRYLDLYPWDPAGDAVIWPHYGLASRHYPPADLTNMRSLYRAEVTQTDHWIGQLIDRLRSTQLLDRTAFIFCSDHGFYFGEHDLVGKLRKSGSERPTTIYEELGHLPLLLRHPTGLAAGQAVTGLCQPPDLFATALDLAALPPVPWTHGRSLVPRLHGQPSPQSFAVGGCHPRKGNVSCLTVWTNEWCFIYSPNEGLAGSELYRRADDPTQTRNLIGAQPAIAQEHFKLLCSWLADLNVPPARQHQLLHGGRLNWWNSLKDWLWRAGNRCHYHWRFRNYARSSSG
jgi:arylsulfatase A-like enzyme